LSLRGREPERTGPIKSYVRRARKVPKKKRRFNAGMLHGSYGSIWTFSAGAPEKHEIWQQSLF